jgi:hypothetical protein
MRAAAAALLLLAGSSAAAEPAIVAARYEAPDDVYPHRIMGSLREMRVLAVTLADGRTLRLDLRNGPDATHVFEDIAPRVADADGDGAPEVVVVETDPARGAQLAVYAQRRGALAKVAATPHIGEPFRWLAPVGIADLNVDGRPEIAYVDRPHLARTLRVWTWGPGGLTEIAALPGLTNHRIGEEVIWGGIRDCGAGPEMILADAGFEQVISARLEGNHIVAAPLGRSATPAGFSRALSCEG